MGLKIPVKERTKTTSALLVSLMNQLEKDSKFLKLSAEGNLYVEGFALNVFAKADEQDRAGRADLKMAKTFCAVSIFFEILSQFGEIQPDIEQKQKYAVWKAADIRKALKEGRRPQAGSPAGDRDLSGSVDRAWEEESSPEQLGPEKPQGGQPRDSARTISDGGTKPETASQFSGSLRQYSSDKGDPRTVFSASDYQSTAAHGSHGQAPHEFSAYSLGNSSAYSASCYNMPAAPQDGPGAHLNTGYSYSMSAAAQQHKYIYNDLVFESWKELGMSRRDKLKYTKFIHLLSQAGLLQEAEILLEEMRNSGVKPTVTAYNNVIHAYAEKGQFEEADKILKQMMECGLMPKPITFTGLIRAYGKQGRYDEMVNVFKRMQCEGCLPDQNTYNVLIQVFARGGLRVRMEEAYRTLISKRWRPDMTTLNAMVEAYAAVGCLDKMEQVFRSMVSRKYFLLEGSLRRMALAYIESSKFYHLEKLVMEIGFERSDKALVWNLLLLSQACLLSCKGIKSVTRNMRSAGFRPDITTINILLAAHLKMMNLTSLNCVFHQMHCLDIRPDLVTVGAVIDAYENGGGGTLVLEYWNRLKIFQCPVKVKTDPVVLAALGKGNFHTCCEQAFLSLDMAAKKGKEWTYADLIGLYFDSRNKGLDQSKK